MRQGACADLSPTGHDHLQRRPRQLCRQRDRLLAGAFRTAFLPSFLALSLTGLLSQNMVEVKDGKVHLRVHPVSNGDSMCVVFVFLSTRACSDRAFLSSRPLSHVPFVCSPFMLPLLPSAKCSIPHRPFDDPILRDVAVPRRLHSDAIKLSTKEQYSEGLYLWDVERMPQVCGAWPSIW
jgi:hypothetical protein